MAETTNGRAIDERWLTARAVAHKLGVTRQYIYKLEKKGRLKGHDVRENGVKIRRFDPEQVSELAESSDLDRLLEEADAAGEDEDEELGSSSAMRLAAKVVTESRQVATDARRGQHEAYELIAKPTREFCEVLMRALEQREKRIAELEEKLNKFHDEQREARLEEREAGFFQSQMERGEARKDAFYKVFTDNLPVLLEQLKQSAKGGAGPFVDWIRSLPPDQQKRLVMAVQAVIAEEEPPAATATEPPAAESSPEKASDDRPS